MTMTVEIHARFPKGGLVEGNAHESLRSSSFGLVVKSDRPMPVSLSVPTCERGWLLRASPIRRHLRRDDVRCGAGRRKPGSCARQAIPRGDPQTGRELGCDPAAGTRLAESVHRLRILA